MSKIYKNLGNNLDIKLSSSDVITIVIDDDININYDFNDGEYKVLVFNNADKDITLNEKGIVRNSNVEIHYLDLTKNDIKHTNSISVLAHSSLNIYTTYLGCNKKKIDFNLINQEWDSKVDIINKVVCLENSLFNMTITGKIAKGAKNCKCHQKSNCLTFENPKQCKVEPILLIDENDVEASHSLSCGTIDEDVLFYMNSRGLDKKAALSLLLSSYLMPSVDFYNQYEDGLQLKEIADKKVADVCGM